MKTQSKIKTAKVHSFSLDQLRTSPVFTGVPFETLNQIWGYWQSRGWKRGGQPIQLEEARREYLKAKSVEVSARADAKELLKNSGVTLNFMDLVNHLGPNDGKIIAAISAVASLQTGKGFVERNRNRNAKYKPKISKSEAFDKILGILDSRSTMSEGALKVAQALWRSVQP